VLRDLQLHDHLRDPCDLGRLGLSSASRVAAGLALVLGLAACATLPPNPPLGRIDLAQAPGPEGILADLERRVGAAHGPIRSGFFLLGANEDGLRWRLALIDSAEHSLDLQYYVWWGDESGTLLMKRVIAAAERGVKVRLILDDLSTILDDEKHARLRDESFALVNAHPNIEIRLFNTWRRRSIAGRAIETLERMERINHRMHNKLLIADNRATIIGGRNVGNEYFGLSPEFNFLDLDVLGIGSVARQASAVFDQFWNSDWVIPAADLNIRATREELLDATGSMGIRLEEARSMDRLALDPQDWAPALTAAVDRMEAGTSAVHSDSPDPGRLVHHMPDSIRDLIGSAREEVLIVNAYIIPDQASVDRLAAMTRRGVRVRILTNSLASHDVPAVNSHYKRWRKPLVESGVELFEIRHDAAVQADLADTPPTAAEFMGLHVKSLIVDRQRVFIGSMNLDPRSTTLNSEMGVIIFSPGLAQALAESFERAMGPDNAWQVTLAADGTLRWMAGDQVLDQQPARSTWQRVEDWIFMAFPRDLY
jgi:putative cardiolipin synthase